MTSKWGKGFIVLGGCYSVRRNNEDRGNLFGLREVPSFESMSAWKGVQRDLLKLQKISLEKKGELRRKLLFAGGLRRFAGASRPYKDRDYTCTINVRKN